MAKAFGRCKIFSDQLVCNLLKRRKELFLFSENSLKSFCLFFFLCFVLFAELLRMFKGKSCIPHHPLPGTFFMRLGSVFFHYGSQILHISLISCDTLLVRLIDPFGEFVMMLRGDVFFCGITLVCNKFHLGVFKYIARTNGYIVTFVGITFRIVFVCISAEALLDPVILRIPDIDQLFYQIELTEIICGIVFVFDRFLVKILKICGIVFYSVQDIFRSSVKGILG